jgi:hypothetical protein
LNEMSGAYFWDATRIDRRRSRRASRPSEPDHRKRSLPAVTANSGVARHPRETTGRSGGTAASPTATNRPATPRINPGWVRNLSCASSTRYLCRSGSSACSLSAPDNTGGRPVTERRSKSLDSGWLDLRRAWYRRRRDDRGDSLCANLSDCVGSPLPPERAGEPRAGAGRHRRCDTAQASRFAARRVLRRRDGRENRVRARRHDRIGSAAVHGFFRARSSWRSPLPSCGMHGAPHCQAPGCRTDMARRGALVGGNDAPLVATSAT